MNYNWAISEIKKETRKWPRSKISQTLRIWVRIIQLEEMARLGALFKKKKRGPELQVSSNSDGKSVHSSEIGAYWEFSYYHYDTETGEIEKVEACQPKPTGRQTELRLKVTCREEKRNEVDNSIKGGEGKSNDEKEKTGEAKGPERTNRANHAWV